MRRREFIRGSVVGALGAAIGAEAASAGLSEVQERLTILHTNDTHSRIDPFPSSDSRYPDLGGVARRATLIKRIRQEVSNVLLLDAGDVFLGTPYFNLFQGELDYKIMSALGYDASTVGNHDFDCGMARWMEILPLAKFPVITSNYDFSRTVLKGRFPPYKILRKGGLKIGVFGLGPALKGLVDPRLTEETRHLDPTPIAKEMVEELRRKRCHMILCLSHLGYRSDGRLVHEVSGIDVIIGGHSHTFMRRPDQVVNAEGFSTLLHQVGFAGIRLGRIDLTFSRPKGEIALAGSASLPVGAGSEDANGNSDTSPRKRLQSSARVIKLRSGARSFI